MPAWSNPQTVGTVAGEPIVADLGEGLRPPPQVFHPRPARPSRPSGGTASGVGPLVDEQKRIESKLEAVAKETCSLGDHSAADEFG
jgi:hypothetical protein